MFDRRQLIVNSKKYFLSNEYLRKVFESNKSQRNIKSKDNSSNFRKIETIQKINVSNEQPLILFKKQNKNNLYSLENIIKKDNIDNKGYLNDGGYKRKYLKYYSYHNTEQNQPKKLFRSSYSQNRDRSKINENQNYLNSKRTSFSMGLNSRTLQKDYSNSIKKMQKRPNSSKNKEKKEEKEKENKMFNSIDVKNIKYRNLLVRKLTDKNIIIKNFLGSMNNNDNYNNKIRRNIFKEKENKNEIDFKRKKEYLDKNNISYDNDNETENENINNNKNRTNYNNYKKEEHELEDIKDIKMDDRRIAKASKSPNIRIKYNDILNNKKIKKKFKNSINQFEFIKKIKKELKNLKKSIDKDNKNKTLKKN